MVNVDKMANLVAVKWEALQLVMILLIVIIRAVSPKHAPVVVVDRLGPCIILFLQRVEQSPLNPSLFLRGVIYCCWQPTAVTNGIEHALWSLNLNTGVPFFVHICLQLSGNVELNSGQPRGSKSLWQSVNPGLVPQYLTPKSFFLVTPSTAQITRVLVEVLLSMLLTIHPCLHCPVVLPVVR